jgi:hypothetical protein
MPAALASANSLALSFGEQARKRKQQREAASKREDGERREDWKAHCETFRT